MSMTYFCCPNCCLIECPMTDDGRLAEHHEYGDSADPICSASGMQILEPTKSVSRTSGAYAVGEVLAQPRGAQNGVSGAGLEYLTVVSASEKFYREEGMSFGLNSDSGTLYIAKVRPATTEEIAQLKAEATARQAKRDAAKKLEKLFESAEVPSGQNEPKGEEIVVRPNDGAGGGSWFVIEKTSIWWVKNNGRDGDDWSLNNVLTAGAGARGRRLPRTPELETLVRTLA